MMIRWVDSPGLGLLCLYDTPYPPGLAPWLPAFHVTEIPLLSRKWVPLQVWQDVILAKSVFPGAYVVDVLDVVAQRKRWERRQQRQQTRLWSGPRVGYVEQDRE